MEKHKPIIEMKRKKCPSHHKVNLCLYCRTRNALKYSGTINSLKEEKDLFFLREKKTNYPTVNWKDADTNTISLWI